MKKLYASILESVIEILCLGAMMLLSFSLGMDSKQCITPASSPQKFEINFDERCAYTRAIHDGEYLQDYFIQCDGRRLMNITPIGERINVGLDWSYPDYVPQKEWCPC